MSNFLATGVEFLVLLQDFEFVSEDQSDSQEPNPEWEKEIESMLGLDDDEDEEFVQKSQ